MGYACPVCDTLQVDAVHLANHLAFTAVIRGGEHEAWLDEHVPQWDEHGESWLGERVLEYADEEELPEAFEEATDHQHEATRDHAGRPGQGPGRKARPETGRAGSETRPDLPSRDALSRVSDDGGDDADVDEILAAAREMTRKRRQDREESETE